MFALVWLIAGILLAAAEMFTGNLALLMLGAGALTTAAVAAVAGTPAWVDVVVFAVASLGLLFLLRPVLLRRYTITPTPTNVAALTGKSALVLDEVHEHAGRVKLDGDIWTARSLNEQDVYPPGTKVMVMKIDGATAVVWKEP